MTTADLMRAQRIADAATMLRQEMLSLLDGGTAELVAKLFGGIDPHMLIVELDSIIKGGNHILEGDG